MVRSIRPKKGRRFNDRLEDAVTARLAECLRNDDAVVLVKLLDQCRGSQAARFMVQTLMRADHGATLLWASGLLAKGSDQCREN